MLERAALIAEEKKLLIESASSDPEVRKKMQNDITTQVLNADPKQKSFVEGQLYQSLAIKQLQVKRQADFLGDITKWDPTSLGQMTASPNLKPIIDSLAPHGPVSVDRLVGSISAMSDPKQKSIAMNELLTYMSSASDTANKGIFGQIGSTAEVQGKIQGIMAKQVVRTTSLGQGSGTFGF